MRIDGVNGSGLLCDMDAERPDPDQNATVCAWLLTLPNWSPAWDKYLLSCVHLREMKGQSRPPTITLDGATHEFILSALDPAGNPDPNNIFNGGARFLTPLNVVEQFIVDSDEQACELVHKVALALVNGFLPAEPQGIVGSRTLWRRAISQTADHIRTGGHPPTSLDEYNLRYKANTRIEGTGADTRTVLPCPFCAAADWLVYPVTAAMDNYQKIQEPRKCGHCGRTARLIIKQNEGSVEQELVQTDGPEPPDWLEPKPRRI